MSGADGGAPPEGRGPLRIVLADDERMVRTALRAILGAEPDMEVVGEAATGAEAVPMIRELRPDVVLMDVRMPEIDGIRATEQVLAGMAEPPRILVVTTFENDAYVYDALRAGAHGFLLKRAGVEDLVQAVRMVARSDSLLFPRPYGSWPPGTRGRGPRGSRRGRCGRGCPTARRTCCA